MAEDADKSAKDDGWIEETRRFQKKTLLFKTLSILWIVPSLTSIFVILHNFPSGNGFVSTLKQIRLEQWLSFFLLLLQPLFIYLWRHFRKTEPVSEEIVLVRNPAADPKKPC